MSAVVGTAGLAAFGIAGSAGTGQPGGGQPRIRQPGNAPGGTIPDGGLVFNAPANGAFRTQLTSVPVARGPVIVDSVTVFNGAATLFLGSGQIASTGLPQAGAVIGRSAAPAGQGAVTVPLGVRVDGELHAAWVAANGEGFMLISYRAVR